MLMNTIQTLTRPFLGALLAAAVLAATAPAAPPESSKGTLFPGAKLMHKFSKEVYRVPILVTTEKGPRLEVWFDAFDPEPPQRISGIPAPDPRLDMVIWDPIANKELHRLSYPKEPVAYPYGSSNFMWSGWMALSPDGKRLAVKNVHYTPPKRGVYGDFLTRIKLIDLETHKGHVVFEEKEEASPGATESHILFAPDGALVSIRGTACTVVEPGKDKPRAKFELTRATEYKTKAGWFLIQQVVASPDGSQLAVAADGNIIVYDLATGKKLLTAERAAPEMKKTGDPMSGAFALAYAPAAGSPKLLAAEWVVEPTGPQKGGPLGGGSQKEYILVRQFDLKDMKEIGRWKADGRPDPVSVYYTPQGEPRVLYDGKVVDGASGKELHKFDPGAGAVVSSDGKALVRVVKKKKDSRTMTVEVWSLDNDK
jgi:hypothetical protein